VQDRFTYFDNYQLLRRYAVLFLVRISLSFAIAPPNLLLLYTQWWLGVGYVTVRVSDTRPRVLTPGSSTLTFTILDKFFHTYASLSPSSIIWYWSRRWCCHCSAAETVTRASYRLVSGKVRGPWGLTPCYGLSPSPAVAWTPDVNENMALSMLKVFFYAQNVPNSPSTPPSPAPCLTWPL